MNIFTRILRRGKREVVKGIRLLRSKWSSSRTVDLVDLGKHKIMVYTDDHAYNWVLAGQKHKSTLEHARNVHAHGFVYANVDLTTLTIDNIIYHVIQHYWEHNIPFVYLDVGSQYGTGAYGHSEGKSALDIGSFIKANKQSQHVVAFEPGIAGELLPYNVELNGLLDTVTVERLAVSFASVPTLFFYEEGNSEDSRILERYTTSVRTVTLTVHCTTIDEYLSSHRIEAYPIVKIDTQGAEPDVLEGMKQTRAEKPVPIVLEFSPWHLQVDAGDFLTLLGQNATIFDLPVTDDNKMARLDEHDYQGFVEKVKARKAPWTDLLVIPHNIPDVEALLNKINANIS